MARPIRPRSSHSTLSATATLPGATRISDCSATHSPSGGRSIASVRSGLMKRCSSQLRTEAMPLPKSPAAASSSSGAVGSPATSGWRRRNHAVDRPVSRKRPSTKRISIASVANIPAAGRVPVVAGAVPRAGERRRRGGRRAELRRHHQQRPGGDDDGPLGVVQRRVEHGNPAPGPDDLDADRERSDRHRPDELVSNTQRLEVEVQ